MFSTHLFVYFNDISLSPDSLLRAVYVSAGGGLSEERAACNHMIRSEATSESRSLLPYRFIRLCRALDGTDLRRSDRLALFNIRNANCTLTSALDNHPVLFLCPPSPWETDYASRIALNVRNQLHVGIHPRDVIGVRIVW